MISYTSTHVALICAWCKKLLREGSGPASHSICKDCAKTVAEEFDWDRQGDTPPKGDE